MSPSISKLESNIFTHTHTCFNLTHRICYIASSRKALTLQAVALSIL